MDNVSKFLPKFLPKSFDSCSNCIERIEEEMRVYLRPQHLQLGFSSRRFGFGQSQLTIPGGPHQFDSEVEQAPANKHTGAEVEKNAKSKKSGENFFLLKVTYLVKAKSETQLRQTSDEANGNNGGGNPLHRYLPPKEPAVDQSHDECGEQECRAVPIKCDDNGRRSTAEDDHSEGQ